MKKVELARYMELIGNTNQAREKRNAVVNSKNSIADMLSRMADTLTGMYDINPLILDEFYKEMGDESIEELAEINEEIRQMKHKFEEIATRAFKALDNFGYANDLEARKLRKKLAEKLED